MAIAIAKVVRGLRRLKAALAAYSRRCSMFLWELANDFDTAVPSRRD